MCLVETLSVTGYNCVSEWKEGLVILHKIKADHKKYECGSSRVVQLFKCRPYNRVIASYVLMVLQARLTGSPRKHKISLSLRVSRMTPLSPFTQLNASQHRYLFADVTSQCCGESPS